MEVLSFLYTSMNGAASVVVKHVDIKYGWAALGCVGVASIIIICLLVYYGRSRHTNKAPDALNGYSSEIIMDDTETEREDSICSFDDEIIKKLKMDKSVSPHFQADIVGRNRHGVAVFGYEWGEREYCLYWAEFSGGDFFKVEGVCERMDDGKTTVAISNDGKYNFRYSRGCVSLNNEPAEMILTLVI